MLAGSAPAARAGNASWAHQAGSLSSNGSVTVKSLTGGTYAATQNPTGAVAKANQTAATQPPTVIIQATASAYNETIPLVVTGTTTIPTCPTGYTMLFSRSGTGASSSAIPYPVFNVAGTRYTFASWFNGGSTYVGFGTENLPLGSPGAGSASLYNGTVQYISGSSTQWAAALCSK